MESLKPSFTFECQNIWRFDPGKQDQPSYVLQATEAAAVENGRYKITRTVAKKNVDSPVASVNWANFTMYKRSEWKQFPMFDINRKLETIMGPMKRTGYSHMYGQKLLPGESSLSPHLIEFASEEHQFRQQHVVETTKQDMQTYDSTGGSSLRNFQGFMPTREANDVVNFKVGHKGHSNSQERNNCVNSAFAVFGRKNDDERVVRKYGSLGTRPKDGSGNSFHNRLVKSNKLDVGEERSKNISNYPNTVFERNITAVQLVGESSISPVVKGSSFFEMLTMPNLFHRHSQRGETSAPAGRRDIMPTDVSPLSSSPPVGTSSRSLKELGTISSPMDVASDKQKLSEIAGTDSELVTTSGSESMDVDRSSLNDSEATSKSVKRLRSQTLDAIPIAAKRLKLGDSSSGFQEQNLLNQLVAYNQSMSSLPQSQPLENVDNGTGDSMKAHPWIRRWCRPNQETSSDSELSEQKHSDGEKLEAKHFPSLAAMALMGKSVNKFRPCEFQKKGSTVVWTTNNSDDRLDIGAAVPLRIARME